MTSHSRGLPKFGEWDVNNPSSADGFTVIFAKARDEKKCTRDDNQVMMMNSQYQQHKQQSQPHQHQTTKKKWLCCFGSV